MSGTLHLYFIACKDEGNGENLDQFVVADTEPQALAFWRDAHERDDSLMPDWVGIVPGVTPNRAPGLIDWDEVIPK
jgi:hypothetical protein